VEFEERDLPNDLELLDINNPAHDVYLEYLINRKIDPTEYPYMVSPEATGRASSRIVVPFTHNGVIVGHSARFLDGKSPRFISDTQQGYVFGTDLQKKNWTQAIIVEGLFDALSINGLAMLHNDINTQQVQLIKSLGRDVTVVPDQDTAGMALVDRALELGWAVSMPEWGEGIKDVNDAVIKFGRLTTLLIILQNRETSRIKIEIKRKKLVKRL
jgi:DNA primase